MAAPTPEQRAAIDSDAAHRVLIAFPGTGKTFTLVRCVAAWVNSGRSPDCITAVTFTRNAAGELRDRLHELLTPNQARQLTIATSHGLALAIIRSRARSLGFLDSVTVYDENDQRDVMKYVLERLANRSDSVTKALRYVEARRAGTPLETTVKLQRAAQEYEGTLRAAGALDFGLIIPTATTLLRNDEKARLRWSRSARYLLVDEYHDTSPEEGRFYEALLPRQTVIVGDPNQEIYAFRGTSNRFLLGAAASPETEVHYLTQSFRSTQPVVDFANRLISHNPGQPETSLRAVDLAEPGAMGDACGPMSFETFEDQGNYLVTSCAMELEEGHSVAVLARTNREAGHATRALRLAGVPVLELTTPREFAKLFEVRAFHARLRARYNPHDEVAARIVFETDPSLPSYSSPEGFRIRRQALKEERSALELGGWCDEALGTGLHVCAAAAEAELQADYLDQHLETRAANVGAAYVAVLEWIERNGDDLQRWVDHQTMRELADAPEPEEASVRTGTLHASKGLEFDTVILAGMHEGHCPCRPRRGDDAESLLLEERRLAYVGITRARYCCELFTCSEAGEPSQFLAEGTALESLDRGHFLTVDADSG